MAVHIIDTHDDVACMLFPPINHVSCAEEQCAAYLWGQLSIQAGD